MNNTVIRTNAGGNVMPLLMYYTPATPIEEAEDVEISYNDVLQITEIETRTIGTYSLKVRSTRKKVGKTAYSSTSDRKNEIDDQKNVK